jgi:lethal(2) giant larvae protein
MLKFLKKHPPKEGEERERLKKELFKFQKCVDHGFPSKPSALAYDPKLKLLAIGTKSGALRIYGTPGFEVSAVHEGEVTINNLFFIPDEGYLVSVCSDGSLHFWEINNRDGTSVLEEKKFDTAEPAKVNNASSCSLSTDSSTVFVGTEAGNVHVIDAKSLTESSVINLDSIVQNVPDDLKASPGAIVAVINSPASNEKLLIGFNKGLIVLWDTQTNAADHAFTTSSQLESLSWHRSGLEFISGHSDGSYTVWNTNDPSGPKDPPACPYGPFPCKAINKIQWKVSKNAMLTAFSGGMPRASYGDRHTVGIIQGDNHIVADLTSRVVDFLVISKADEKDAIETDRDDPHTLVILAEEELVVFDLEDDSWPTFRLPYLNSVHSSAITCTHHASNVPEQLWRKLSEAGDSQHKQSSNREWPINGGKNLAPQAASKDILLTGHEDGTVRFWDASTTNLRLLYKLQTSPVFGISDHAANVEEEEWPPFRKVGTFDPYSDDPRLAIQKLVLCPISEVIVVAGSAGQVLILGLETQEHELDVSEVAVNIMGEHDGFVWKGHDALTYKSGDQKYAAGFQPICVVQLDPPAACTALALHTEWQLVAAGTGQGFALVDYAQKKEVITRCTLNPEELTGTVDIAVARAKSLKKSLRESFRRLRRRRSEKSQRIERTKSEENKSDTQHIEEAPAGATNAAPSGEETAAASAPSDTTAATSVTPTEPAATSVTPTEPAATSVMETAATPVTPTETAASAETAATPVEPAETAATPEAAVTPTEPTAEASTEATAAASSETATGATGGDIKEEKQVEPKVLDSTVTSMVRSLYFADTFVVNATTHNPSLWVGTSCGHIFVYSLTIPASDQRSAEQVQVVLAKEIKLKHRAPVLGMAVIDGKNTVLPDAFEVIHERAKAPDMEGQHSVIICSEEQLKTFSLPALKPRWKTKITAVDGARLRKLNFVTFRREGDAYSESDIACVTSAGDVRVYSVSTLRGQLTSQSLNKEDLSGISSYVFTKDGQGFYLQSPSEFSRISLSAINTNASARCELELAEGLRPPPPEPKQEEPVAAEGSASLIRQPTVEVTPASEEQSQEAQEEPELPTSLEDSHMDKSIISADITVDSVRDMIAENENTIVTSVRTITKTTTSTVSENVASAGQEAQKTVTVTNGVPEELHDGVTDVLRETQHEVTTRTSEFVTRTTEKVTHTGEEVVKHLSELKMTTAVIEDPSLLKQKLVDSTTTTSTTSSTTVTTNGEGMSAE